MTSSLRDLLIPLGIDTIAEFLKGEVNDLYTQITDPHPSQSIPLPGPGAINDRMQNAVAGLLQDSSASEGVDFSGLGAAAFRQTSKVHLEVTGHFTGMLQSTYNALDTFTTAVFAACEHHDGLFASIQEGDYAPGYYSGDPIMQGAYTAFAHLNPKAAMITDILANVNGDEILQSGGSVLSTPLGNAYGRLNMSVEQEDISIPSGKPSTADEQWQAKRIVLSAIDGLYFDLNQVYTGWGNAIQQAFTTFTSAMTSAQNQIQPFVDLLTNPTSAASIYNMIGMIAQTDEPIAIVQTGPNTLMVYISGTNGSKIEYDTNIWNALMTDIGQDSPYEQDVIDAIQKYCREHGLTNPNLILAGHSMGGMIAQQLANKTGPDGTLMFNVSEVITFGAPVIDDPNLGVTYHMYEADGDLVPLLSRYENPTLPSSYQQLATMFPDINGGNWTSSIDQNAKGLGYLLAQLEKVSPYLTPQEQQRMQQQISDFTGGQSLTDLVPDFKWLPPASPEARLEYMDPRHLYNNPFEQGIQRVPDLTNPLPNVHSQYGQSQWLEQQKIVLPETPDLNVLGNIEYFGFSPGNLQQTAQITQYMKDNSIASLFTQMFTQ
jgi:pimeloyl-ACP methyl ester carboxylesterase